jgi:hypothetical protein
MQSCGQCRAARIGVIQMSPIRSRCTAPSDDQSDHAPGRDWRVPAPEATRLVFFGFGGSQASADAPEVVGATAGESAAAQPDAEAETVER